VNPDKAKTEAETAFAGGVMTESPGDDALVQRSTKGGDGNGLSIMSDWNEFRMSAAMESVLKGYADPRLSIYFLPAVATGQFDGLRNGLTVKQLGDPSNKADNLSHAGARWASPSAGGINDYLATPQQVMESAEVFFLRAEGAMLGWSVGGTPKDLYEAGITNSMKQWGVSAAATTAYINSTATPVAPNDFLHSAALTNIPVKFDAANQVIQREQIAPEMVGTLSRWNRGLG
jgi:hypothetical protein